MGSGDEFTCEHCGSIYSVKEHLLGARNRDSGDCRVCRKMMAKWDGLYVPIFKLKKRLEDA